MVLQNMKISPIQFELGHIVSPCLTVMHKINACVGNNAVNSFALYMNAFPCTLSLPHVATWDTVLVDHPLAAQDVASFQQAIQHFIAVHATDEDHHELRDYIRSIAKPRKMDVQTYYSCLCELNNQVNWLPGTDLPITENQLNQAFFDGMPILDFISLLVTIRSILLHLKKSKQIHTGNIAHGTTGVLKAFFPGQ
jgi:hypothetical protein